MTAEFAKAQDGFHVSLDLWHVGIDTYTHEGAKMQGQSLASYSDDPVYNMKAVTQRTGIPAATLRAWERRYHALAPCRSEGNYRLYSERDIAVLRWLQAQLDAGLSISRAVALLERLREQEFADPSAAQLPLNGGAASGAAAVATELKAAIRQGDVETWERLVPALFESLLAMDEQRAGAVLGEAFALYTVEDVCIHVIAPVMALIGDDWLSGKCTVVQEHFASIYLVGRLMALFNAQQFRPGPLILVGCAPGERHELGALMLALMLRRRGHNVRYLGADVPMNDLIRTIVELRPSIVAVSVSMAHSLGRLDELRRAVETTGAGTHLILGGRAFALDDDPAANLKGDYAGTDIHAGIATIERLLGQAPNVSDA